MSNYKFNDYEVQTIRRSLTFGGFRWYCYVYFRNNVIAQQDSGFFKEVYALNWAKDEIIAHKQEMKLLEELTKN